MDFSGVALVIGAGGVMGRELAFALAARGVQHLICADLNEEAASETARQSYKHAHASSTDFKAHALAVDVADEKSVQDLADGCVARCGRIDYYFNSAGFVCRERKPVSESSLEAYRRMSETHNIGTFLCLRAVLRVMLAQEPRAVPILGRSAGSSARHASRGAVVIVTSIAAEHVFPTGGNYIASKWASKGIIQTAAIEHAGKGIRINAVAPTFVNIPDVVDFLEGKGQLASMVNGHPLGRLVDPDEVVDAALFLASGSASYVNGQTLLLDGGASLVSANTSFEQ